MAAAPSLVFLLGSILFALRPGAAHRRGWLMEVAVAVAALLVGILLTPSLPWEASLPLWSSVSGGPVSASFALTSWSRALWISALSLVVWQTARWEIDRAGRSASDRAAWLGYAAAVALALLASDALAAVAGWTLLMLAERRLDGSGSIPRGADLVAVVLLAAAAVAEAVGGAGDRRLTEVLLLSAGVTRVLSAVVEWGGVPSAAGGEGFGFCRGSLALATVLVAWSRGLSAAPEGILSSGLAAAGGMVALGSLVAYLVDPMPGHPRRSWVLVLGGLTLFAAGVSPPSREQAFAGGGIVLLLGAVLVQAGRSSTGVGRISPAVGAMLIAGAPFLAGAFLLGAILPGAGPAAGFLRGIGAIILALLAGGVLAELFVPGQRRRGETLVEVAATVIAAWAVVTAVALFLQLRSEASVPSVVTAAAVGLGSIATALGLRSLPAERLARVARALRLPRLRGWRRPAVAVVDTIQGWIRGVRDVLEGDASLLWSFVVLLVVLLIVQQGPS